MILGGRSGAYETSFAVIPPRVNRKVLNVAWFARRRVRASYGALHGVMGNVPNISSAHNGVTLCPSGQ